MTLQGKFKAAEAKLQDLLKDTERVLGIDHPEVFDSLNNLASAMASQSRYQEATEVQNLLIARRERVLGPQHLNTMITIHNTSGLLYRQ